MSKNITKQQFYIDRDTSVTEVITKVGKWFKTIVYKFLEARQIDLQEEKAGGFRTVTVTVKIENKELTRLHAFFRGAVVIYYIRQSREMFEREYKVSGEDMKTAVDEMKEETKFYIHDEIGKVVGLNSFAVFENTKKYTEKLNEIEKIMFDDNGYLFPDSEEYNADYKAYGRQRADMRALQRLIDWNEKQYKKDTNS